MRKTLFIILIVLPFCVNAQFSTYKKGEKVGIEFNQELIVKAKYNEVILKDDSIATAIKKKKIYYINSEGEIIYKGLTANCEAFENGLGIAQSKKRTNQLINRKGSNLLDEILIPGKAQRHGVYVQYDQLLFSENGLAEKEIDSVVTEGNYLKVFHTATVTNVKTIKVKLFKKKKVKDYSYYPYFSLYKLNENVKLADDAVKMDEVGNGILITTADGFSHLYNKNGGLKEHSLSNVIDINQNYFSAVKDSSLLLFNKESVQLEISGKYTSYQIKNDAIWGLGKNGIRQAVDIYNGTQLKVQDWNYLQDWDEERSVFRDSLGQFVAWNNGDIISKKYVNFSKPVGYYMLVQNSTSYTWLDVDIFEELSFYYPQIVADVPIRQERKTGLFSVIPNILHAFFGPRGDDRPTNRELVDAGHQFYEGWAICPTNVTSQATPFDSAVYIGRVKNLKYNYINKYNKRLNDKKYSDCFPFINGKAWVKERGDYYLIDKEGKKSGSLHFQSVELDEKGNFIVENFGSKGIVNSNYELVVPPRHLRIHRVGNNYFDNFTSDKKLLWEMPN